MKPAASLLALLLLDCISAGLAAGAPTLAPDGAGHAQRFRYDPEASFAILALPGVPTDLQLAADERVTGFALGDTIQWVIEELPGHVFIKPLKSELFTAGTLVTDRRTYQLTLRSGHPRDEWMQRVTWSYPDLVVLRAPAGSLPHAAERVAALAEATAGVGHGAAGTGADADRSGAIVPGTGAAAGTGTVGAGGLDPARLDFDYRLSGDAPFRPLTVFDDGRSNWLRMPARQTMPALFLVADGSPQLVHYVVRGDWLVVPRLAARLILKLGRSEVQVQRHADTTESWDGGPRDAFRR